MRFRSLRRHFWECRGLWRYVNVTCRGLWLRIHRRCLGRMRSFRVDRRSAGRLQPLPRIAEELLPLRVGIDVFAQLIKQRADVGCRVGGMPDGVLCERADVSCKLGFEAAK